MKIETTTSSGLLFSRQQSASEGPRVESKSFEERLASRWRVRSRVESKANISLNLNLKQATSTCNKYHRAAIDGYIDMLCDASKRDTNLGSELNGGLTPTLLAAQNGHLEALRILVGRGGDPERTSFDGSGAIHLAAARNHLNCVSFLVNFGANMWALDNELHTAKDVAAISQAKEVLDYLDQMMAKQSALNTKNVQKLKERAKFAAEKRLKRMRKAQLKAIKQAEKDERYLVRMSNNRRLLKAAHSISDIKLVGRTPIMSPNNVSNQIEPNVIKLSPSEITQAKLDGDINSSSPSLANFLNHKLHMDLLSQRQAHRGPLMAANTRKQINFMLSSCSNSHSQSHSNSADDSSAYSSASISTGYLSCSSAGALARSAHHLDRMHQQQQPKYSDLVAVNSSQASAKTPEQQSLKSSNSTLAARLWGIGGGGGGVSRKVQLKRMLLITNSTHDLYTPQTDDATQLINQQTDNTITSNSKPIVASGSSASGRATPALASASSQVSQGAATAKLCNVQPTIKLKMQANSGNMTDVSNIKWPPAPTMTRAVSEPDFGAALRQDSQDDVEDESAPSSVASLVDLRQEEEEEEEEEEANEENDTRQEDSKRRLGASLLVGGDNQPDESQHQLLTQCLSQLRLRHEAISRGHDETLRPSKVVAAQRRLRELQSCVKIRPAQPTKTAMFGHSDELIQLRQCVNGLSPDAPLKPSAIKLQQQQQQHQNRLDNSGKGLADSIGSAGSFAHRNSRLSVGSAESASQSSSSSSGGDSSCGKLSANSPSSTYSSTYTSSIELLRQPKSNDAMLPLPPPPPPPPPPQLAAFGTTEEDLGTFLRANGLLELSQVFAGERIDLEALMLLSEDDLKSLSILLGPRRKLLKAIENRRLRLVTATAQSPVYLMVDTPL